jgi:ABC-type lipoprotein release transport system permease subunit
MGRWIQKQRFLVDYVLAALLRRKARNLGLLAVYAAIVFLLASVMLFTHALRQEAQTLLQNAPEILVQRMVAGRHDLIPGDYLASMGRIRGLTRIQPRLWGYFYDPTTAANYTFMVPTDPASVADLGDHRIAIGAGIARTRGAGPGDVLAVRSYRGELVPFRVQAVLEPESELVTADVVLLAEADFRAFFGIPAGQYTDIALSVRNPREVRTVAKKVALALPDTRPILRQEILRTYESIFSWREGVVLILLVGAILAFVIFAWDKASGLSAEERREIGILKAIGWETGDIITMKFWEGVLISVGAFLIGYVAAYIHVFVADSVLFEPVLRGWAVLYPRFQLIPSVDGLQLATLFLLTVFPYAAATIVPIWRTAIADPDAVMR